MGSYYSYFFHTPEMVTKHIKCNCGNDECKIEIMYDNNCEDLTPLGFMSIEEDVWEHDSFNPTEWQKNQMRKFCFTDWAMGDIVRPDCMLSCDPEIVSEKGGNRCWNCNKIHPIKSSIPYKKDDSIHRPPLSEIMRILCIRNMEFSEKRDKKNMLDRISPDN